MRGAIVLLFVVATLSGCMDHDVTVKFRNRTQEAHQMNVTVEDEGKVIWAYNATVPPTSSINAPRLQVDTGTYRVVLVLDGVTYWEDEEFHNSRVSLDVIVDEHGPSITGAVY